MRRPSKVKIGPSTYSITTDPAPTLDAHELWGYCDTATCTLHIDASLRGPRAREVVMHEVLHACLGEMGGAGLKEERIVATLAPILLAVLRDNPALMKWLRADN
jgi:hypothetical protein